MASMQLVAEQINRLKAHFGDKAFSEEFVKLIRNEIKNMADGDVIRCVDLFIGNRPHHKAPVLDDFRQARLSEQKVRVEYAAKEAIANMRRSPEFGSGLKKYLEREFPGCKTLNEAIEVRKLQIRLAKAEDPNYDPMCDRNGWANMLGNSNEHLRP